jgi:hypothetical protein
VTTVAMPFTAVMFTAAMMFTTAMTATVSLLTKGRPCGECQSGSRNNGLSCPQKPVTHFLPPLF